MKENSSFLLRSDRIVCDCYKIRVDDIKKEILAGRTSVDEMAASIRLGVLCSACIGDCQRVIDAILERGAHSG